jgi:ribosomal protein L34E
VGGATSIESFWRSERMERIRAEHRQPAGPMGLPTCAQCLRQNYRFKGYRASEAEA